MPYRWHSSVKLSAIFSDNRTYSWRKDMRLTTPHGISSPPFRFQGELCLWLLKKCYPCLRYTCYLCLQSIHGACPDHAPPRSAGLPRRAGGAAHAGGRAASRGRSREKCFKLPIRPKFDEEFPLAARCEANTKDDMKVFDSPPTATPYRKINGFALALTFLQAHAIITRA